MAKDKLNAKHLAFIDEYLICMNATQAYRIVYPKSSYETARRNASDLLTKTDIKAEIQKRMKEHAMSANEVIKRTSEIARGSLYPFLKIEGKTAYIDLNNPEAQKYLYLIKDMKQVERETYNEKSSQSTSEHWVEIKLHDALKALETLARIHKLLTDKVEIAERKVIRVTIGKQE